MSKHTKIALSALFVWLFSWWIFNHITLVPLPGILVAKFLGFMTAVFVVTSELLLRGER